MNPGRFMNQPCQVESRQQTSTLDQYGKPGWETTTTTTRCALFPAATATLRTVGGEAELRPAAKATHQAFLPPETVVDHLSALIVNGKRFEVEGAPQTFTHPSTLQNLFIRVDLISWNPI